MSAPPVNTPQARVDRPESRERRLATGTEQRAAAFALAAALPLLLALNDGGYDIVIRQEVALGIWWALALGFAFGIVPRARPQRVRGPASALALLVAWVALSLWWTESDERTVAELARLLLFAGTLGAVWLGAGPRTWTSAAAGLSAAALAIPALAVLSRLAPELSLPGSSTDLAIDRLIYPLGYWNAVACWGAIAMTIAVGWSAHLRSPSLRALCLAAAPVAGLAIYFSYSRGGLIAASIGLLAVVAISQRRRTAALHGLTAVAGSLLVILVTRTQYEIATATGDQGGLIVGGVLVGVCVACALVADLTRKSRSRHGAVVRRWRTAAIAALAAVITVGVLSAPSLGPGAADRVAAGDPASLSDPAARLTNLSTPRPELWSAALDAFASDPVRGTGPGTFEFWWARHGEEGGYVRDAHSLYVESLAELGAPGLLLVVALLGGLLAAALRGRRAARGQTAVGATTALTAAFLVYVFHAGVDWMWESTAVTVLALAAAAIAAAAASKPHSRHVRLGWRRPVAVAVAVAVGAVQIPGIVATERVRASRFERFVGELDRAETAAGDAVRAEPWAATPYTERALVRIADGRPELARTDALEAVSREPANWRHQLVLARAEAALGDQAAAARAVREAKRLRPALPLEPAAVREAVVP